MTLDQLLKRRSMQRWFYHQGSVATLFVAIIAPALLGAQTQVGPFEITRFYQFTANPSSGHVNPNNFGLLERSGAPS